MKKIFAILLAAIMMLSMVAMAQEKAYTGTDGDGATITISNAANDETYSVYKLFDATVAAGSIAYQCTGDIPAGLTAYFTKDAQNNVTSTEDAWEDEEQTVMSEELKAALETWAKSQTATASETSDGTSLKFTNLPYGYYVVISTQETLQDDKVTLKSLITVASTYPNADIVDKNSSAPLPPPGTDFKTSDADGVTDKEGNPVKDVKIGDTVTYTVRFNTANYEGEKQILTYVIEDTLPSFLTNVQVTSVTVDGAAITPTPAFSEGKMTINWTDGNGKSLYANGAELVITYTATVSDDAAIDGEGNTNTVSLSYTTAGGSSDKVTDTDTVYTYAIAIKKVDNLGKPLANAVFQLPFYVKATADEDGAYIYAGETAADGLVNTLTTPADGVIIVKGVEDGTYDITETQAPDGYNKLTAPVSVTATKTGATTTTVTKYIDENGNVVDTQTNEEVEVKVELNTISAAAAIVVNMTGSELPSTGGIGTTIFYVVGGLMMAAAVVLLVAKKKVAASK